MYKELVREGRKGKGQRLGREERWRNVPRETSEWKAPLEFLSALGGKDEDWAH